MSYYEMTDEQAQKEARRILRHSRTDEDARKQIGAELSYPNPDDIDINSISDGNSRLSMGMMRGPSGATLLI